MAHRGVDVLKEPKKAKQVTGDKTKLAKLAELKKVNKTINKMNKADDSRFRQQDKLFTKKRKLQEQLGIV